METNQTLPDVAESLAKVREKIVEAARSCGRDPQEVTLVAVTKTVPVERINQAIRCGVTDIGENRVQELLEKYDHLENRDQLRIHLIGRLQTNKVKYIADKVHLIHSVDSWKLLQEIEKQCAKVPRVMDVLLEVNLSGEEQKGGMDPRMVPEILEKCGQLSHIRVRGMMTVPPLGDSLTKNSRYFCLLQQLFIDTQKKKYDNVDMSVLSMGMSNDFDVAIQNGSTMVRVGSAIFGKRI
ncbi:MAG: YggS family pyridoxal phosphate-dependent enzyme [Eubacteriales bacterium]|jgi:pyridoxal phosphate enzyme (YggS family)